MSNGYYDYGSILQAKFSGVVIFILKSQVHLNFCRLQSEINVLNIVDVDHCSTYLDLLMRN